MHEFIPAVCGSQYQNESWTACAYEAYLSNIDATLSFLKSLGPQKRELSRYRAIVGRAQALFSRSKLGAWHKTVIFISYIKNTIKPITRWLDATTLASVYTGVKKKHRKKALWIHWMNLSMATPIFWLLPSSV